MNRTARRRFFVPSLSLLDQRITQRIFRTLILSEAVLALIFLHSASALGKWYYVGDRNVAETFLGGDRSAAAPSGTPQYADLLDGYAVCPSWQVAGVDYAVGAHPDVVLVPTAGNLPPGTEVRVGTIYVTGNNVTLSGYNLTGLTVMITDSAQGTVTITDCVATSNVNIRSTVGATANLVVTYCALDGGGKSAASDFQLIKVWTPLTVEYCLLENAPAAIYAGAPLTVKYNAMSGFAWGKAHTPTPSTSSVGLGEPISTKPFSPRDPQGCG